MKIIHNNLTWLNLANPQAKDLEFLDELAVSPNVIKELMNYNKRPKVEEYDNYLFLVLHFPVFHSKDRQTIPTELDFIITRDKIITVYQNSNPCLEQIFRDLQNDQARKNSYFKSAGFLLFCVLDRLIDSCLPMLDHIHEKLDAIEQDMFKGKEKEMLKEIAIVKQDIIDFRRTLKPQKSVLELLIKKAQKFFGADIESIAQEAVGSEVRVWNILENHKEMIEAIEKTNEGLLSYQISRVMHTLTFFSIILFSLTFIASFFSMRSSAGVFAGNPYAIWIIGAIMLADVILITILFKRKKWM